MRPVGLSSILCLLDRIFVILVRAFSIDYRHVRKNQVCDFTASNQDARRRIALNELLLLLIEDINAGQEDVALVG